MTRKLDSGFRAAPLPLAFSDPRGHGMPVLFVHGFGHNRVVWEKLAASLPESWRPIAVDLRGHAESPWSPAGEYELDCYAADLDGVVSSLGIERVHVVAHSLGGNVATLFAAGTRARILSLVLVDTGPSLESGGSDHVVDEVESALRSFASVAEYRAWLAKIHPMGDGALLDRLAETGVVRRIDGRFEPALDPGVLGEGGLGESVAPDALAERTRTLWQALGALACPVLVVRGGLSAILSEKIAGEMVDQVLLDGRLVTLPRAGHGVMLDDPDGLARAVVEFLGGLPVYTSRASSLPIERIASGPHGPADPVLPADPTSRSTAVAPLAAPAASPPAAPRKAPTFPTPLA
ncbi:MAG: alpha/beta hydrolase [Deltaproteobacteria bacterium]|nr:alpha/beta hydrolase [Deltaproteobacteria bacterium]